MAATFSDIPNAVIDYVRETFATANEKVSRALTVHPALHEESLDHILVAELTATPPAFFAAEKVGLVIESHWLGGRRMYGRWEIADIAFFVILRKLGRLQQRKVALLQTKRLYSKEISVAELDDADFAIGIGRLGDRTDPLIPLSTQRAFSFENACVYGAMRAGSPQISRIDSYVREKGIPVYYGLYNPLRLPHSSIYPAPVGADAALKNDIGCRIIGAPLVHNALASTHMGSAPSYEDVLQPAPLDNDDPSSRNGWRLERFVADEVLRCRQGALFNDDLDPNLRALFYERSAPITAAISITIDLGADSP